MKKFRKFALTVRAAGVVAGAFHLGDGRGGEVQAAVGWLKAPPQVQQRFETAPRRPPGGFKRWFELLGASLLARPYVAVKRGLLCQLFGGSHKQFIRMAGSGGSGKVRGDINVLLGKRRRRRLNTSG